MVLVGLWKPALAGFFICWISCFALADPRHPPKWEAGLGIASQGLADYRGSGYYNVKAVALPYVFYHGDFLKVDRRGARGELIASESWELNLSADASLSAGDEDNPKRVGMDELHSTLELGPSFNINLTGDNFEEGWSLRLPLRSVFAVGGETLIDHVGFLANPRLTWRKPDLSEYWRVSFNTGAIWGSRSYHGYYYDVLPNDALPDRPAYRAKSGYSGWTNRLTFYRAKNDWRFAISFRADVLSGATFADSPLVETKTYGSISIGVAKRFWAVPHK